MMMVLNKNKLNEVNNRNNDIYGRLIRRKDTDSEGIKSMVDLSICKIH